MKYALNKTGIICNLNCYFNDEDNPNPPASYAECEALSLTSAVAWNNVSAFVSGSWYNTPELKTILQPIIDRPGFVSGNKVLGLLKDNNSDDEAHRLIVNYDAGGGETDVTELYVEWTTPSMPSGVVASVFGNQFNYVNLRG